MTSSDLPNDKIFEFFTKLSDSQYASSNIAATHLLVAQTSDNAEKIGRAYQNLLTSRNNKVRQAAGEKFGHVVKILP
jgi:hypothetical protein